MSVAVTAALLPAQATGTIVIASAMAPIGWELSASTKRDSSAAAVEVKYCTAEEKHSNLFALVNVQSNFQLRSHRGLTRLLGRWSTDG